MQSITSLARRIARLRTQLDPPIFSSELPKVLLNDAGEVLYETPFEQMPLPWRRLPPKEYIGFDPGSLEGSKL